MGKYTLSKIIKKSEEDALCQLGMLYEAGVDDYTQDFIKARYYYDLAEKNKSLDAIYNLACMDRLGKGLKKPDFQKAKERLETLVNKQYLLAFFELALMYEKGQGMEQKDIHKAVELYKQAIKSHNDSDSRVRLGFIYLQGINGMPDFLKATKLFEKAVEKGNLEAKLGIGHLYLKQKKYKEAKKCFATESNKGSFKAMMALADMCQKGEGGEIDLERTDTLYDEVAKNIEKLDVDELLKLGDRYKENKNYKKALECYKKAKSLEPHHAEILLRIGDMYENGLEINLNLNMAKLIYQSIINLEAHNERAKIAIVRVNEKLESLKDTKNDIPKISSMKLSFTHQLQVQNVLTEEINESQNFSKKEILVV